MAVSLYQVVTVMLILLYGMAGFFKLFPWLIKDPRHDFVGEFRRFVRIFPLRELGVDPDIYRITVGVIELVCALLMAISHDSQIQGYVTYTLGVVMGGAFYTHYMLGDPMDMWVAAVVGVVLIGLRLYAMGRIVIR